MGGLIFGLVIGAAVLFVPVFIGVVIWRGRQVKVLAERGVNVEGRVVRRFRSGSTKGSLSRGRRIEFEYVGPDGKTYTRYHNATRNEWEARGQRVPARVPARRPRRECGARDGRGRAHGVAQACAPCRCRCRWPGRAGLADARARLAVGHAA
jgi:hypothetical protein